MLSEEEPVVLAMQYDQDSTHAEVRPPLCVCVCVGVCLGALALDAARNSWRAHAARPHARPGG